MITLQDKTLFISAGHSDTDPGAVANGLQEAGIVTHFRDALGTYLTSRGIVYAKDGAAGENLPLRQAQMLAAKHDVAVEFHTDAASPAARGCWTLSRQSNFPLAAELCYAVSTALGIPNRGAKPEGAGQHARLGFVSKGGGIVMELFFLTSSHDVAAYREYSKQAVAAVGDALIRHITRSYEDEES
jgi:N-acetylmuramoyl-L-alanine amidase